MSVVEGLERDLERMPADVRDGAEAAAARILAVELDGEGSTAGKAVASRALREAMDALRERARASGTPNGGNRVDAIRGRRRQRNMRAAAA